MYHLINFFHINFQEIVLASSVFLFFINAKSQQIVCYSNFINNLIFAHFLFLCIFYKSFKVYIEYEAKPNGVSFIKGGPGQFTNI